MTEPRKDIPDLFGYTNNSMKKDGVNITRAMLRWMLERGTCTSSEFKAERVKMGGTVNQTHSFDRYFADKQPGWRNHYVPPKGSYHLIERTENKRRYTWIGSEGATFYDRALAWVTRMSDKQLASFLTTSRGMLVIATDVGDALGTLTRATLWFVAARETSRLWMPLPLEIEIGTQTSDAQTPAWWCRGLNNATLEAFQIGIESLLLSATEKQADRIGVWAMAAREEDKRRSATFRAA